MKRAKGKTIEPSASFNDYLVEQLRDPEMASEYINIAIEEGDVQYFLHALGNVVKARGMTGVTKQAGINRENAYKAVSKEGNPTIKNVSKLLYAVGLTLRTEPLKKQPTKKAA
jgi:probable addiction module antidote protein